MKLTLPQQDIYFEQLLYPNDPIYNIGAKVEIKGPINVELFKKAYVILINQHDAYRMTFVKDKDNVEAKILDSHDTELGFMDFSCKKNPEEEADSYIQNEFLKPFDLFSGALLHSFTLIKIRDDVHYFFSFYHHILTDGWGISLMFQRLIKNYRELSEFGEVKTVYPFTYKDFAKEDEEYETSEAFIEDRDYWTQKFASLPESLFDKIDDRLQLNKSSRKELLLKREVYNKLNELATVYKSSTFHLILAVLFLYFGRKQQNTDFAVGLPVLNRSKRAYKNTVGLFMGVSPLRIQLDFEATFEDLVNTIKSQLRKDYRHQRFPLGKLIQELHIFKEKERLFNLTLSYEKQNYADNFPKTTTRALPLTHESERVALAMYIREYDESEDVRIDFDYNLNYFDASSITQVVNHFEHLINEVLLQPDKKLKVFNYLSEAEEQQLLEEFNNTTVDYARDETFVSVFKTHVEKAPEKTAVQDMLKSYTYSELHTISNQIAEYLITTYREDNAPIAVMLGRSADMIAVLLGIIKSGRGYIPLDPAFPKDRLQYILESSQTRLMISEPKYVLETTADVTVLDVERVLASAKALEGAGPISLSAKDTAYIIYTSGSTGNPKGVEIGHQSLLNFLLSIRQRPGVTDKDTLFSVTTYSFDISILEFFTPLVSGATLYIANQAILSDPATVIEQLKTVRPSIMQATPSFYQMLFNAEWEGDKTLKVLCGGDLLSESLAAKLLKHSKEVWNMYGPTETTIWSSIKHIEAPEDASNIGKPINNTQFYIVDHYFNIMPIGSVGSLYIGGEGLAKGYYKNTALTDERFIKNPFGGMGLIYETGDIGRWNAIGEIEFLGRNDNQVKIRGYRIELGEIETKLNEISAIKQAVVIAKKTNQQEAFLAAFVVLQAEAELNVKAVIEELKTNLPEYMIPYAIIPLEKFPLTPNRKVDRKALSERTFHQDTSESKAPTTDLEIKLASYWKEILHPDKEISVTDNFFALGGHSLNAVRLTTMVKKHLSFLISLKTIFDYPTIESLAQYLQKLKPDQSVD
ncbi:MAG: amino acid adenylation domain-containing protein, partial [Bacteroidota bacterium]